MAEELSKPQKLERAIRLRAAGHSVRFIGEQIGTPHNTIVGWFKDPKVSTEIDRIRAEELPDIEDDAQMAREFLRGQVEDEGLKDGNRTYAAKILLDNRSRVITATAAKQIGDAAERRAMTPVELAELEQEATRYLETTQDASGD